MRFDGKNGLLAADWTRVMDDVLNPPKTSPQSAKAISRLQPFDAIRSDCKNGDQRL